MGKKHLYSIISIASAIGFTLYIALNTFVLSTVYEMVEPSVSTSSSTTTASSEVTITGSGSSDTSTEASATEATITDTTYEDDNIKITVSIYREYDTDIYVADIELSSADYLKTAFANSSYGKNVTAATSEIADSVNSILAINGDYYGVQESGYVIRNGVLYRNTADSDQEDLVIYQDGSFEIINEEDISAEDLLANGAYNVLSFGPGLIENSEISVSENDEVAKAMTSNPRTAIGIIDSLHYCFVVSDGRTDESEGLSLYELASFMQDLGINTAYNLDGGGSSTMVFEGTIINNPTSTSSKHHNSSSSSERSVSDIVYIGY